MESPLPPPQPQPSSSLVVTAENALAKLRVVEEDDNKKFKPKPPPTMTPLSPIKTKTDEEETARKKKPTLLEKMRPTSLKTKSNENQPSLRMKMTASTDELLNLEIREKNYRECRHEASTIYENFLYVGGDELVKKEKRARKLKEELNVRRILCCYDNDSNNGGLLNDECLSPGSCASGTSASTPTPRTTEGGSSSDDKFDSSTYFERMSLPLMDTSDEDIACVLYDAFDFMLGNERRECVWEKNINRREKEEEEGEEKDDDEEGGCLVHCQMGCSRSVAICVAFVMWREGLAYDEAFERVKKARSIARPNIGFVKTLEAWHEARTNRSTSSSSSMLSNVVSYRIVEHKNRKGYIVPKRENNNTYTNNNSSYNNNKDNNNNIGGGGGGGEGGMSPVSCCLSSKDDPNLVALRFKNETFFSKKNTSGDDDENTNDYDDDDKTFLQPTITIGDRVDRENDPRVDEQTLDKITKQILFYEYGVRVSREF
jgi:dual specificity MAP kinase phosphatase